MKTAQQKQLEKRVYRYLYSYDYLILNRKPKLDMRFKESKEFLKLLSKLKYTVDVQQVKILKKSRLSLKPLPFKNILANPLTIDLLKNKQNIKWYNDDLVQFTGGRNHWAKSDLDRKIIRVFKNHSRLN